MSNIPIGATVELRDDIGTYEGRTGDVAYVTSISTGERLMVKAAEVRLAQPKKKEEDAQSRAVALWMLGRSLEDIHEDLSTIYRPFAVKAAMEGMREHVASLSTARDFEVGDLVRSEAAGKRVVGEVIAPGPDSTVWVEWEIGTQGRIKTASLDPKFTLLTRALARIERVAAILCQAQPVEEEEEDKYLSLKKKTPEIDIQREFTELEQINKKLAKLTDNALKVKASMEGLAAESKELVKKAQEAMHKSQTWRKHEEIQRELQELGAKLDAALSDLLPLAESASNFSEAGGTHLAAHSTKIFRTSQLAEKLNFKYEQWIIAMKKGKRVDVSDEDVIRLETLAAVLDELKDIYGEQSREYAKIEAAVDRVREKIVSPVRRILYRLLAIFPWSPGLAKEVKQTQRREQEQGVPEEAPAPSLEMQRPAMRRLAQASNPISRLIEEIGNVVGKLKRLFRDPMSDLAEAVGRLEGLDPTVNAVQKKMAELIKLFETPAVEV